ncbi:MAG: chemotaxis response regulator protein-glutamate methylesterase [Deltaproteobacteria bacterium]|nr:chemotaxis response regulator protein-glutamate methylesterase [Deltaproteobacteria bacterium]
MSITGKIRVLIVDDSSFMRKAISGMLREDPVIEVCGEARDGLEAIEKVASLRPDVVTMDIEMPRMDGIEALRNIMERTPVPVIMISSLSEEGAKATFEALDAGALDFIPKHLEAFSFNIFKLKSTVIEKIKTLAGSAVKKRAPSADVSATDRRLTTQLRSVFSARKVALVAIGASTGGPKAVEDILKIMPADFPVGVLVIQHMPASFTGAYAERLNSLCGMEVKEAKNGDQPGPGLVLVAPGGHQMRVRKIGAIETRIQIDDTPSDALYKPCVDVSFLSVAECYPARALGVILTGMGKDGFEGTKAIKQSGGPILVQDESSCVVYGMPKAVVDGGLYDKVVSLSSMAGEIMNLV